jgi:hypothetical protein
VAASSAGKPHSPSDRRRDAGGGCGTIAKGNQKGIKVRFRRGFFNRAVSATERCKYAAVGKILTRRRENAAAGQNTVAVGAETVPMNAEIESPASPLAIVLSAGPGL